MSYSTITSNVGSDHVVSHDYNNSTFDKNSYSSRPSTFNGDVEQYFWWKIKMYSNTFGIDEELWDIVEDGIDIPVKSNRIPAHKKI